MKLKFRTIAAILCMAVMGFTSITGLKAQDKIVDGSITEIKNNLFYSRAVEAAIWAMPLMNFDAMRQAYFRDAGARYNDVIYFSKFANWKFQTTTPNNSTNYVMFFCNLKDGPVVVKVPAAEDAALFGSLISSWTSPLIDVGNTGEDKGKGGKYLLLPPDYKGNIPADYINVPSDTYNIYSLLRVIPKSEKKEDVDKAIAYLHKLKIYPLSDPVKAIRYIDVYDKPFEGIASFDLNYYVNMVKLIKEEPVRQQDLVMMGLIYSLGIGKNIDFEPDASMKPVLERAIKDAHAYMIDGFAHDGITWWPGKQWKFLASQEMLESHGTSVLSDRVLVDDRSFVLYGAFGPARNALPNLYVKTFFDADGKQLNGSNTYKVNVPPNAPVNQFWSVIAQDVQTAGFIRNAKSVGVNSFQDLKKNTDGSVDVYFSPNPPAGYENNWVSTAEGKSYFLLFRLYGATPEALKRTSPWTLNDLIKIKQYESN